VQVDRAALELELVDLALTVIMAAGLEREQFGISRELLQLGQQFSYRHASLLCQAQPIFVGGQLAGLDRLAGQAQLAAP
jgi:hypothetical protein